MCRNIKTLFNFDPPATDEEIRAASLQFVRKLSGFNAPSKTNEAAFNRAIEETFLVARWKPREPGRARPSGSARPLTPGRDPSFRASPSGPRGSGAPRR